jgi:hypothetical protein
MVLRYRLAAGLAVAGILAGCAGRTPYEQLMAVKPTGSAFSHALYHEYARLAQSLHISELPGRTAFDARGSISLSPVSPNEARLALHYAQKAESAASGEEPLPEEAPSDDRIAENVRLELLRMLSEQRNKAPLAAAQAQANYDCWILDARIGALSATSQACHTALLAELARLREVKSAPAASPKAAPAGSPVSTKKLPPPHQ